MIDTLGAVTRLGIPYRTVVLMATAAGVPKTDLKYVTRGLVPPIKMSKTRTKRMHSSNPAAYRQRWSVILELLKTHFASSREQEVYGEIERK
jgi:hypothetical protein